MSASDGGPAFPHTDPPEDVQADERLVVYPGMSLRDYFAGQALAGIMGDPGMRPATLNELDHMTMRMYQVADAMLKAREVTP